MVGKQKTVKQLLRQIIVPTLGCFLIGSIASTSAFASVADPGTATTSNGPAVLVSGTTVSVVVPEGSDNSLKGGAVEAVVEQATGTLPSSVNLKIGYGNSCAGSQATGITACSALLASSYLIAPPTPPTRKITGFRTGARKFIHFTGGDCVNCGSAIDDGLNLAIFSTSIGYLPVQLSPFELEPLISTNAAVISGNFGYDPINHRIISPSYQLLSLRNFSTGNRHFQIIDANTTGGQVYELTDNPNVQPPVTGFYDQGTCTNTSGVNIQRDGLPDSGAYDTVTGIAYVTFRSPSACRGANTVEDIGLADLTQASFDSFNNVWSDPAKQVQTLTEMTNLGNGITGIAIVPGQSYAIVDDQRETSFGNLGFGALQLPSTSGSGTPSIPDWVAANMPARDPSNKIWQMAFMPNGVAAYTSPNSGKAIGVLVNRTRTYVALVDIVALLNANRMAGTQHTIDPTINLVNSGIITYVSLRPHK